MKRIPFIPFIAFVLFCCLSLPVSGALCEKCRDRSYQKDIGECTVCDGLTTSGEFKLCLGCSTKLGECAFCRGPLAKGAGAIDTGRDGTYAADGWTFEFRINNAGSRSKGTTGTLSFRGAPVPAPANVNDYHVTPWGRLYWIGQPVVPWGAHGWMPKPLGRAPAGAELPAPVKP